MDFEGRKQRIMEGLVSELPDKSRKGGVDAPILPLISRINAHPHFCTTSSCSGRISILAEATPHTKRKGGEWLYVSHDIAAAEEVVQALLRAFPPCQGEPTAAAAAARAEGERLTVLRFEPLILAVECANLSAAQALVSCAISSGFRESGVTTMGKRIVVAIRCSIRMEVPIAEKGMLLVSLDYIRFLVTIANNKMMANRQRTSIFFSTFIERLEGHSGESIAKASQPGFSEGPGVLNEQILSKKGNYGKQASEPAFFEGPALLNKQLPGKKGNHCKQLKQKLLSKLERRQMDILSRIASVETQVRKSKPVTMESKGTIDAPILKIRGNESARISEMGNTVEEIKPSRTDSFDVSFLETPQKGFHLVEKHLKQPAYEGRLCMPVVEPAGYDELAKTLCRWGHSTCILPSTSDCHSSQLLIFGGYGGPGRHTRKNDLLLLDCKFCTLTTLSTETSPTPRMGHTASMIGMNMVVIGGREDPSRVLNDVCTFNLETMQWAFPKVNGARFPARHRHAAAVIGGKIYVFGGFNSMVALGDLFVLDIDRLCWSRIEYAGEVPFPRYSHALAVVGKNIYLFGGSDGKRLYSGIHVFDVEKEACKVMETTGSMPLARFSHSMISFNRYLLLLGGCPVSKQVNQLFFLDIKSLIWRCIPLALSEDHLLVRHTANLLDNQLVIIGGGASCYAFGTKFSRHFAVDLRWLVTNNSDNGDMFEHIGYGKLGDSPGQCAVKITKANAKKAKDTLKMLNWLDLTRKAKVSEDGSAIVFPITKGAFCQLHVMREKNLEGLTSLDVVPAEAIRIFLSDDIMRVISSEASLAAESLTVKMTRTPQKMLRDVMLSLLIKNSLPLILLSELPKK